MWRQEEQVAGIELGSKSFWFCLTQPKDGNWPPDLPIELPIIDPSTLKLTDLPDPVVGEKAISLWNSHQEVLPRIPGVLEEERQKNGPDSMLKLALGDPLPDLESIKNELDIPDSAESAAQKIVSLHLTVESFRRLLFILAKVGTTTEPTRAEWTEVYAIITVPYKARHLYPDWKNAEETLSYWQLLKARLPRWRASNAKRPFGGPHQILSYLANYTHRVALSNRRIVSVDAQHPERHLHLSRLPARLTAQGVNPFGPGVHPALQLTYPTSGTGAYPALWYSGQQSQKM